MQEALEEARADGLDEDARRAGCARSAGGSSRATRPRRRRSSSGRAEWDAAVDAGGDRAAAARVVQGAARDACLPADRHRRPERGARRGPGPACLASSALTSGRPTASSPTWTDGIPRVIPDAEGRALLPSIVAFTTDRRPRGRGGAAAARAQRRAHRLLGEAPDGPRLRGRRGRAARTCPSRWRPQRRGRAHSRGRSRGHAARGLGPRAARAEAARGGGTSASRSSRR